MPCSEHILRSSLGRRCIRLSLQLTLHGSLEVGWSQQQPWSRLSPPFALSDRGTSRLAFRRRAGASTGTLTWRLAVHRVRLLTTEALLIRRHPSALRKCLPRPHRRASALQAPRLHRRRRSRRSFARALQALNGTRANASTSTSTGSIQQFPIRPCTRKGCPPDVPPRTSPHSRHSNGIMEHYERSER